MVNDVLSFQCEPGYTLQVGILWNCEGGSAWPSMVFMPNVHALSHVHAVSLLCPPWSVNEQSMYVVKTWS